MPRNRNDEKQQVWTTVVFRWLEGISDHDCASGGVQCMLVALHHAGMDAGGVPRLWLVAWAPLPAFAPKSPAEVETPAGVCVTVENSLGVENQKGDI